MKRKKVYKSWDNSYAGRCRNCGTLYIPAPHKGEGNEEGEVEEQDYCGECALRCPNCLEWLTRVEVDVRGRWTWYLAKNDETGKFYASDHNGLGEDLLHAQCPRCGFGMDRNLLET